MDAVTFNCKELLDTLPSGIVLIDAGFNIRFMNRTFQAMWHMGENRAIGRKCFDVFSGPLCHTPGCPLTRIAKGGGRLIFDDGSHCKCGRLAACNVTVEALKDGTGGFVGIVENFTDAGILNNTRRALIHSHEKLRKAMGGIIQAMSLTIEKRDPYTAGHQRRVAKLCRVIGTELGLGWECIQGLRMAAAIHDLGKISVPAAILNKPGHLSAPEMAIIRQHPRTAYEILENIEFPWPIAEAVYQHQERLDGSGYPRGLSGGEIILEARIIAVADVAEAISSFRPYRQALGTGAALAELRKGRDILFDAHIVDICLDLFERQGFDFNVKFRRRPPKEAS